MTTQTNLNRLKCREMRVFKMKYKFNGKGGWRSFGTRKEHVLLLLRAELKILRKQLKEKKL